MKRPTILRLLVLTLLAAAATQAGAQQTPAWGPRTLPASDCAQLAVEVARVDETRRAAVEEGDNAWKAIVPFVVLARKASSKAAVDEADKKLGELKAQTQRLGCAASAS